MCIVCVYTAGIYISNQINIQNSRKAINFAGLINRMYIILSNLLNSHREVKDIYT